jgi:MFS family permease
LALAAIHFGQAGVSVGLAVFIAQIIKGLGLTNMQTGFTTAIPYIAGTIGMLIWGRYSDKHNERRWNLTDSWPRSENRAARTRARAIVAAARSAPIPLARGWGHREIGETSPNSATATRRMLQGWGALHARRSALGLAATLMFLWVQR